MVIPPDMRLTMQELGDYAEHHKLQTLLKRMVSIALQDRTPKPRVAMLNFLFENVEPADVCAYKRLAAAHLQTFPPEICQEAVQLSQLYVEEQTLRSQISSGAMRSSAGSMALVNELTLRLSTVELQKAVWEACDEGAVLEPDVIQTLLAGGADPTCRDPAGELPLCRLLRTGSETMVPGAAEVLLTNPSKMWGWASTSWSRVLRCLVRRASALESESVWEAWQPLVKTLLTAIDAADQVYLKSGAMLVQEAEDAMRDLVGGALRSQSRTSIAVAVQHLVALGASPWSVVEQLFLLQDQDYSSSMLFSLMDAGAISENLEARDGTTILAAAVQAGNLAAIKGLLKRGAEVTAPASRIPNVGIPAVNVESLASAGYEQDSKDVEDGAGKICFHGHGYGVAGCPALRVRKGKWYFELEVLDSRFPRVGWSSHSPGDPPHQTIGTCPRSWAVDGEHGWACHDTGGSAWRQKNAPWCMRKDGVTIGAAVDFDSNPTGAELRFAFNGEWDEEPIWQAIKAKTGLFPAFSSLVKGEFRFKTRSLKYQPPNTEYLPLGVALEKQNEEVEKALKTALQGGFHSLEELQEQAGDPKVKIAEHHVKALVERAASQNVCVSRSVLLQAATCLAEARNGVWASYRRGRRLGEGFGGEVWQAWERSEGAQVAVKITRRSNSESAKAILQPLHFINHPLILPVMDVLEAPNGSLAVVSDYVEEGTLRDLMLEAFTENKAQTRFDEKWVAGIISQALRATAILHKAGVQHGNLKLDNFFVGPGTKVKGWQGVHVQVGDFGLASSTSPDAYNPDLGVAYDPRYASPEKAFGRPSGSKSDIWSLGVVLFELLTGGCYPLLNRPVFSFRDFWQLSEEQLSAYWSWLSSAAPLDTAILEGASDSVKDLVLKMLAKDPADRPTCEECLEHSWFEVASDPVLAKEYSPVAFKMVNNIERLWYQNAVVQMLLAQDTKEQTTALRKRLSGLTVDSTGRVAVAELQRFAERNSECKELTQKILKQVDPFVVGTHGSLEWCELFDAATDYKRRQVEELHSQIKVIISEMRIKKDGAIHLAEFKKSFPMAKSEDERLLDDLFGRVDEKRTREIQADELEVFFYPWLAPSSAQTKPKQKRTSDP